jgi:hypothetical protein
MVGIKVCLEIEGATMEERGEPWFCSQTVRNRELEEELKR